MKIYIHNIIMCVISIVFVSCMEVNEKDDTAQEYTFDNTHWEIENTDESADSLKIVEHQGRQAIVLEPSQKALLKDSKFKNFILDFHCNGQVPGFGFRVQDPKNYEYVYLRMMMSGKKDALQYVPIHNGNLPWQLYNYPQYEGNAKYERRQVATLPLSMEGQLVSGKASDSLLTALEAENVLFSEESFVDIPDGSPSYIYDPQSSSALLFEKREDGIAFLDIRTWVHVKAEVIARKMSVYVENMDTPTFVVDDLKHDVQAGAISLYSNFGEVYFSNFSITEIDSIGTHSVGEDTKQASPNFITKWHISEMFAKDSVQFVKQVDSLLKFSDSFKTIMADKDGLVNISRFYDDMNQTVLLSSRIISDQEKEVTLHFDYADHLVILMNSEILFDGGMDFRPPPDKGTEGRVFVNDEKTILRLHKGVNDLIFMLSGDNRQKYNWGFIAKIENLDGISME